jgi:hypothetical protein
VLDARSTDAACGQTTKTKTSRLNPSILGSRHPSVLSAESRDKRRRVKRDSKTQMQFVSATEACGISPRPRQKEVNLVNLNFLRTATRNCKSILAIFEKIPEKIGRVSLDEAQSPHRSLPDMP